MTDNSWYERGELPPVGSKVKVVAPAIALDTLSRFSGLECLVLSHFATDDRDGFVLNHPIRGVGAFLHVAGDVEPIKSDRDKAIEAALKVYHRSMDINEVFSDMYDAGLLRLPD